MSKIPDISQESSQPAPFGGAENLASAGDWRPDELASILKHQLDAPLAVDLFESLENADRNRLEALAAGPPAIVTFRDLLMHKSPPTELLSFADAFARRPSTQHGGLPQEVARAIAAAASAAQSRLGAPMAESADIRWLAELPWADAGLRQRAQFAAQAVTIDQAPAGDPTSPHPAHEFVPDVDGYTITGRLGEGGMGVVWRARQLSTGRSVALKLMSAATFGSERARLRFEREVRLTARLDHPQIAGVYESGLHRGAYYYAMELVEGVPVNLHVRDRGLDERQIMELVGAICTPVAFAHVHGIVHRDLKPGNILVDDTGLPHVLDFGLAKAMQESSPMLSLDGEFAGTPAFMSPEQASGGAHDCDARTDVYASGVIAFQLLTDTFPHDVSGTGMQVLRRIADEQPRRLIDVRPGIAARIDALLGRALSRQREERFANAGEFASAIDACLADREPLAVPRRRGRRVAPWIAAVGLALLAGCIAVVMWNRTFQPLPPIDGGPWVSANVYVAPGTSYVVSLHRGSRVPTVEAWRIDWGTGEPAERIGGDATSARHVYAKGRYQVRVAALVNGKWHAASTCGEPVHRWQDHYYTLTGRRGGWIDALDDSWSRGAGLVSINNAAEQDFLVRTFLAGDAVQREWYWIGLTERAMHRLAGGNDNYTWTDDSDYRNGYKNWAEGCPSDPASDNDAAINFGYIHKRPGALPATWNDLNDRDLNPASAMTGARGIIEFTEPPSNQLLAVVTHSGWKPNGEVKPAGSRPAMASENDSIAPPPAPAGH